MNLPVPERIAKLRDPAVRAVDERAGPVARSRRVLPAGVVGPLHDRRHVLRRQRGPARARSSPTSPSATNRGTFDTLLDIVINDDLRTVLWPLPSDSDLKSWQMRAEAWDHPLVMIGGSDAGAHLDRMCGAPYTTSFLADCAPRPPARLARTLRAADDADARAAVRAARPRRGARGLPRRPRAVRPGDGRDRRGRARRRPARRHEPALRRRDRRAARVRERHRRSSPTAKPTDARPGTVLRSGRDTYTVPIPADA